MPVMNGYEATDKIRHVLYLQDALQPLIVAMTTNSGEKQVDAALDSGMNSVLQKPVQVEELKHMADLLGFTEPAADKRNDKPAANLPSQAPQLRAAATLRRLEGGPYERQVFGAGGGAGPGQREDGQQDHGLR